MTHGAFVLTWIVSHAHGRSNPDLLWNDLDILNEPHGSSGSNVEETKEKGPEYKSRIPALHELIHPTLAYIPGYEIMFFW